MSDKDMIIELLGIAEVAEDETVDFTDRAKEIIMDLAEKYRKTPIYEQAKKISERRQQSVKRNPS